MGFKKFRADHLFDGYRMHNEEMVLVTREDGTIEEVIAASEAGGDIREYRGILSPGFINCHCHLELSHMRGAIPEGTGLTDFVFRVVSQRHFPEATMLEAIERAEDEMIVGGIVAAGDICNNALTIPQKLKARVWYHNFIEASGFNPQIAEERFQRSVGFFAAYSKLYAIPIESNSITPHAPYSVADELWEKIINFPGNHLFTIHNQETGAEDEWFRNKQGELNTLYEKLKMDISFFRPSGKSSLQTFLPKFLPNQSVILVHNVFTSGDDIDFARNTGRTIYWCLCPNANWYINKRLPDIDLLMRKGCELVLGTDSLASNHQLSILEEIKKIREHFPRIELPNLLQWATSNGARALQIQPLFGSFEKNKRPGIVLVQQDLSSAERLA